jgi:predicted adenylyl cyclase CyaB
MKRREETEVRLDDAESMSMILAGLGFHARILFEKRRETWELGLCLIEFDELPELGLFVEVEGPDEGAIRRCLGVLGLAEAAHVAESYAELISQRVVANSSGVRELRF